jgi:hypothetical protein
MAETYITRYGKEIAWITERTENGMIRLSMITDGGLYPFAWFRDKDVFLPFAQGIVAMLIACYPELQWDSDMAKTVDDALSKDS